MNLNKSLADELNQPTSFPTARSNKNLKNPITPKNTVGWAFEKRVFLNPNLGVGHQCAAALDVNQTKLTYLFIIEIVLEVHTVQKKIKKDKKHNTS